MPFAAYKQQQQIFTCDVVYVPSVPYMVTLNEHAERELDLFLIMLPIAYLSH